MNEADKRSGFEMRLLAHFFTTWNFLTWTIHDDDFVFVVGNFMLSPIIQLQAPVVQTLDSAINRINHYPVDKNIRETSCVIQWQEIYPVDCAFHLLNKGRFACIWQIERVGIKTKNFETARIYGDFASVTGVVGFKISLTVWPLTLRAQVQLPRTTPLLSLLVQML